MVQEDKFTISGNGSTNGNETKIDLHLETSQTLSKQPPVEAVATANLGKADPQVSHSQPQLPGGQKNIPHLNVPVDQVGPNKGSLASQSVPHKTTAADPRLSPPKKGKYSNENSLPNPVANKPFPSGHIVPPVALPEKFPLPAEKPSVPKPSKSSKAQSRPRPVTNKAFPGGHIVPPVALPEKFPLPAEKPRVPTPPKASKAKNLPSPVTNKVFPGGHIVPPVALPEKITLPDENPTVPTKAKRLPCPITNKAFPSGRILPPIALPDRININTPPNGKFPLPDAPSTVTFTSSDVPPLASPSSIATILPAQGVDLPTPSKASKGQSRPSSVANKAFPSRHNVPSVALPGPVAPTSTSLAEYIVQ